MEQKTIKEQIEELTNTVVQQSQSMKALVNQINELRKEIELLKEGGEND